MTTKPSRSGQVVRSLALPAWVLSLLLHSLLAFLVLAVGTAGGQREPAEEVEHEFTVQLAQDTAPPPFDAPVEQSPAPAPALPPRLNAPATVGEGSAERPTSPSPSAPTPALSRSELDSALTVPQVRLPGPPNAVETKFFGTPGRGAKFVYVIDRSASMNLALPIARTELIASLQALPPTVEYQVVYYDLAPRVLEFDGKAGLFPATAENKSRTTRVLDGLRAEGGTDHIRALKRALALNPHVIYFLTDADELKPQQVQELTLLNQRGSNARIHCIELSAELVNRGECPMRALARENCGEYRAVDVRTLPARR